MERKFWTACRPSRIARSPISSVFSNLFFAAPVGTVSLSGVYGGVGDPLPMLHLFDKGIAIRMGQCNVHRWIPDLWPLVEDPADPLGIDDLVTHHGTLDEAPGLYRTFRDKADGCIKVMLQP